MAEEKTKKKKAGIVRRILKWIGLVLLSILLIATFIFQAPWKVITLLVIILLACTALPKQMRKWFWLSAGAVVIALIIWVFLPDDNEGWRPYTFDEELAAIEAARAIPDSENAATIYNQLLDSYDSNSFYAGLPKSVRMGEPWLSREHPKIAEWLEKQEGIIEKLIEASRIENCSFPITADIIKFDQKIDRLAAMRHFAYLLVSAANNDIAEGRINKALKKNITLLQMAKHRFQQPTIVDMLFGTAVEALVFRQFNSFVVTGDAAEEHLSVIEQALADIKHDWSTDLPRILECEKLFTKNFLLGMFYGVNPEGKIKLTRGLSNAIMAQLPEDMKDELVITYWHKRLMKVSSLLCWFYMPSTPQKASEIIDAGYERLYAMAEPDFDWQKGTEKPTKMFRLNYRYLVEHLTGILEPAYHRIHDLYLRLMTDKKGRRIIIALRRYKNQNGFWPETLDEIKALAPAEILVDPTNESNFVYKLTEENFTLYSKGKNNIDENGEYQDGADDWLIWPPKGRKTKEENADDQQQ